jgi:hypothetical protein
VILALSLAVDSVIFEGLLGGDVRKGFAFLLRQECYLRCVVAGCFLGGHRGLFFRRTNGGHQMLEPTLQDRLIQ